MTNQPNADLFEFGVNPPDPVGNVGPSHYLEMVNLAFTKYSKTGDLLIGPVVTTREFGIAIRRSTQSAFRLERNEMIEASWSHRPSASSCRRPSAAQHDR